MYLCSFLEEIIQQFQFPSKMIQKGNPLPFLVRPQPILFRGNRSPQQRGSVHRLTCKKQKGGNSLHSYMGHSGLRATDNTSQTNWLRYNILVSIYDNWIRLAPFIIHLLQGKHCHGPESPDASFFQKSKKFKSSPLQHDLIEHQFPLSVQNLLKRRRQMQQKSPGPLFLHQQKDIAMLRRFAELSNQIISSLPIESRNWTKAKIQRHNNIIDDYLSNYNQQQFNHNFDTILNSLKERMRFIQTIQDNFVKSCDKEKDKLAQKLEMLKKPFSILKKEGQKENQERCEAILKALASDKNEVFTPDSKLKKKAKGRHTVYKLNYKDLSGSGNAFNKNHTFNSSSPLEKSFFNRSNGMERVSSMLVEQKEEEDLADLHETQQKESSKNDSITSINFDKDKKTANFETCQPQKSKLYSKEQLTNLLRGKYQKRSIQKETSFIMNNQSKGQRASALSLLSDSDQKNKKQSTFIPSIEEIDELELEHHFNKGKSHKKIGTMKFINGGSRRGRITKDSLQPRSQPRESNFKPENKTSKMAKNQRKKDFFQNRKGNLLKKGAPPHKQLDIQTSLDECANWQNMDWQSKKQKLVQFLRTVHTRGWLDDEKHQQLKAKTEELLYKCSPATIANNRKYAKQIEQKNVLSEHHHSPPAAELSQKMLNFLKILRNQIQRDGMIGLKIKNQLQILFDANMSRDLGEDHMGNQRYFLHSCEFDYLKDQIRRIEGFREEGERISVGNEILKMFWTLNQKEL